MHKKHWSPFRHVSAKLFSVRLADSPHCQFYIVFVDSKVTSQNASIYQICRILWVVPPPRIPVTTRTITFLVGDPYKPSFATVTGRGDNPKDTSGILGNPKFGDMPNMILLQSKMVKLKLAIFLDLTMIHFFG